MKKILAGTLGLAACLLVGTVAFAAATEVMKGTPVIDGKKDAMYSQTISIPLGDGLVYATAADNTLRCSAISWLLYDDNYFYVYGEVIDPEVEANPDVTEGTNPWFNDAFENWVDLGDGGGKATVSPFINYSFDTTIYDLENAKLASTKTAKSYTVEIAIPKTGLTKGGTISYVLQLNDFTPEGAIICYGAQTGGLVEYTLGGAVK